MTGIRLLKSRIQPYAWGSHTSIATIQGRPAPTREPEAELWIGDHPNAPSRVRVHPDKETSVELRTFLANHPAWLGFAKSDPETAGTAEKQLPFLLKILAADAPLSLQVHPSAERARKAFANGHPAYVDEQPKPEVLCALTPFRAMVGFRAFDESAERVRALQANLSEGTRAHAALADYTSNPGRQALRDLLAGLHGLPPAGVHELIAALRQLDLPAPGDDATAAAIGDLLEHYPNDPLCLAPLLLQVVTLQPGEAIHTEAGILHSYLGGTGVELMNTSDNVLRAGLTEKAVHLEELLDVTRFEPTSPGHAPRLTDDQDPFDRFQTPSATFELGILEWRSAQSETAPPNPNVQILLCTSGQFTIKGAGHSRATDRATLPSGQSLLIGADWGPFHIEGEGQLFRATVPGPRAAK